MQRDSISNTLQVALVLCLVCSVLVSVFAVGLRSRQQTNQRRFMQRKVLEVARLCEEGADVDVDDLFGRIETRVVDLRTGEYADESQLQKLDDNADGRVDAHELNQLALARDPQQSMLPQNDIAGIKRRENYSIVYEIRVAGELKQLILPIRGYGLWSTLMGFLALDVTGLAEGYDRIHIRGLTYYSHKETPGLGGEVDNKNWRAQWDGKKAFDADGRVLIEVAKGASGDYQVDALSGATITSQGVSNMLEFWLGEQGFGPFLARLKSRSALRAAARPATTPDGVRPMNVLLTRILGPALGLALLAGPAWPSRSRIRTGPASSARSRP